MSAQTCRIGAGAGFWGDALDPAVELVREGRLDYVCFELLAELSVSLLQRITRGKPDAGFVPDLAVILPQIVPLAVAQGTRIITNGGAANPHAAGSFAARAFDGLRVASIDGDDVTDQLASVAAEGWTFRNLDTGEEGLERIAGDLISAHAYTGADGIVEALDAGAQLVIGGRIADASLYCGALRHHFGWTGDAGRELGTALTVGHVLECAGLASGGMSVRWREAHEPWHLGFPLAEVGADGSAVITKVEGSGGLVDQWTIKEHLLYEVHDPCNYVTPDGVVDYSELTVEEVGPNRVALHGTSARERTDTLKVQVGYRDGYLVEGYLLIPWPDAHDKAEHCLNLLDRRLEYLGIVPLDRRVDFVGRNALAGNTAPVDDDDPAELMVRIALKLPDKEAAAATRKALISVGSMGPAGLAHMPPPVVRPLISLWPTLIPRAAVRETVQLHDAAEVRA